jgi:hypothetical protein
MLIYNTSILSTNKLYGDVVKVYPNPVSDFIHVTVKNNMNPLLQLYSISGVLIKEIRTNKLNVSDIATGTYILKVKLSNANLSYPIFIVR